MSCDPMNWRVRAQAAESLIASRSSLSGSGHKFDDVSPPYAHRSPTLDNIVIYGGDTVGIRRDYGQAPYVMELMLVTT
jgi:hypothetical protein